MRLMSYLVNLGMSCEFLQDCVDFSSMSTMAEQGLRNVHNPGDLGVDSTCMLGERGSEVNPHHKLARPSNEITPPKSH